MAISLVNSSWDLHQHITTGTPAKVGEVAVAYVDKVLTCIQCGCEFVFTAGEQQFLLTRSLSTIRSAASNAGQYIRSSQPKPLSSARKRRRRALNAGRKQRSRLSQLRAGRFCVAPALKRARNGLVLASSSKIVPARDSKRPAYPRGVPYRSSRESRESWRARCCALVSANGRLEPDI